MKISQREIEKKLEVKRNISKLEKHIVRLKTANGQYFERAKKAKLENDSASYSLARTGLGTTLSQLATTEEMLLNMRITQMMKDTGSTTETFLTTIGQIFKQISKINKSVNLKRLTGDIMGAATSMQSMQENLDVMLGETASSYEMLSSVNSTVSSDVLDEYIMKDIMVDQGIAVEPTNVLAVADTDASCDTSVSEDKPQPKRIFRVGGED